MVLVVLWGWGLGGFVGFWGGLVEVLGWFGVF